MRMVHRQGCAGSTRCVLEATTPGVPSLARIPSFKWTPRFTLIAHPKARRSAGSGRRWSSQRLISRVQWCWSSASTQDGKTTVAANLAVVLAQAGRAVALVDADLRHPHLHHMFESVDGLDGGLTSAVIGRTEMADAAHELNVGNGRLGFTRAARCLQLQRSCWAASRPIGSSSHCATVSTSWSWIRRQYCR